jgi:hypothetical protein
MRLVVFIILLWLILAVLNAPYVKESKLKIRPRVVCSLTTRPKQPHYFHKVLDILVKQFDAVYLAIPKISCKGIPYPIVEHEGVTITTPEKDYGPITKYFAALDHEKDPDTLIVVVDDDILYSPNLKRQFVREHAKYSDCVLSGAGIVYKYSNLPWFLCMNGRRPYFPSYFPSFLGNRHLTTVAGYSGVAFKRSLISKTELIIFIESLASSKKCFVNDDIVISAYFSNNNVKRIYAEVDDSQHPKDKDTESLSDTNNNIMKTQHQAYLTLKECFENDPVRYDCFCVIDIIIILLVSIQSLGIHHWVKTYQFVSPT